jgi:hypothetical protein
MRINMTNINIEDINETDVTKLFSHYEMTVSAIDIDREDNSVNVYIEISSMGTYTIDWIDGMLKKLRIIKDELIKEGLINDLLLGDIYKGVWRVSINFKTVDEAT